MSIVAYSGWEFKRICVDCTERVNDLTLEEAKKLLDELAKAITHYEEAETEVNEYFDSLPKTEEELSEEF